MQLARELLMKPRSEFISQCNLKLLQWFHLLLLKYLQWLRLLTLRVKTKTLRITKVPLLLYIKVHFCYYTPTTSYIQWLYDSTLLDFLSLLNSSRQWYDFSIMFNLLRVMRIIRRNQILEEWEVQLVSMPNINQLNVIVILVLWFISFLPIHYSFN